MILSTKIQSNYFSYDRSKSPKDALKLETGRCFVALATSSVAPILGDVLLSLPVTDYQNTPSHYGACDIESWGMAVIPVTSPTQRTLFLHDVMMTCGAKLLAHPFFAVIAITQTGIQQSLGKEFSHRDALFAQRAISHVGNGKLLSKALNITGVRDCYAERYLVSTFRSNTTHANKAANLTNYCYSNAFAAHRHTIPGNKHITDEISDNFPREELINVVSGFQLMDCPAVKSDLLCSRYDLGSLDWATRYISRDKEFLSQLDAAFALSINQMSNFIELMFNQASSGLLLTDDDYNQTQKTLLSLDHLAATINQFIKVFVGDIKIYSTEESVKAHKTLLELGPEDDIYEARFDNAAHRFEKTREAIISRADILAAIDRDHLFKFMPGAPFTHGNGFNKSFSSLLIQCACFGEAQDVAALLTNSYKSRTYPLLKYKNTSKNTTGKSAIITYAEFGGLLANQQNDLLARYIKQGDLSSTFTSDAILTYKIIRVCEKAFDDIYDAAGGYETYDELNAAKYVNGEINSLLQPTDNVKRHLQLELFLGRRLSNAMAQLNEDEMSQSDSTLQVIEQYLFALGIYVNRTLERKHPLIEALAVEGGWSDILNLLYEPEKAMVSSIESDGFDAYKNDLINLPLIYGGRMYAGDTFRFHLGGDQFSEISGMWDSFIKTTAYLSEGTSCGNKINAFLDSFKGMVTRFIEDELKWSTEFHAHESDLVTLNWKSTQLLSSAVDTHDVLSELLKLSTENKTLIGYLERMENNRFGCSPDRDDHIHHIEESLVATANAVNIKRPCVQTQMR